MSTLVGNLVDPDPGEVRELVELFLGVGPDPGDDRSDRAPRDAHQDGDRGLGSLRGQPRDLVIKEQSVTALVPRPRNGGHGHAVDTAGNTGRVGLEVDLNRAHVQRSPATSPITDVVTRAAFVAGPASVPH